MISHSYLDMTIKKTKKRNFKEIDVSHVDCGGFIHIEGKLSKKDKDKQKLKLKFTQKDGIEIIDTSKIMNFPPHVSIGDFYFFLQRFELEELFIKHVFEYKLRFTKNKVNEYTKYLKKHYKTWDDKY